jgi:serine protease Do
MVDVASPKIVIRHTSGTKSNRVDSLPVAGLDEIRLGRDTSNTIIYDNGGDDGVSRKHAVIKPVDAAETTFSIEDLGSANGTFVNKKKITGKSELLHGDSVMLGLNGPAFTFTVDPPPSAQLARTKMFEAPLAATRILNVAETTQVGADVSPTTVFEARATKTSASTTTMMPAAPAKAGIGRETMLLEIGQAKRSANRQWVSVLGVIVLAALGGAGFLYWKLHQEDVLRQKAVADLTTQAAQSRLETELATKAQVEEASAKARQQAGMSAHDIVQQYGPATAESYVQWRLYDQVTGRPIFLKIVEYQGKKYPLFAKNSDGTLSPWLTLDDENRFNRPIEEQIQGTAFVVNEQGYLLTNKHLAAGWRVPFIKSSDDIEKQGILVSYTGNRRNPRKYEVIDLYDSKYDSLLNWIPETGGLIYPSNSTRQIGPGSIPSPNKADKRDFAGRNDSMTLRFAETRTSINATLVRSSDENDAALIKVDEPTSLQKDEFSDHAPTGGEKVVVLGFPAVAEQRVSVSETIENGIAKTKVENVPIPYVTEGIVALSADKIISSTTGVTMFSQFGNLIQLTINSTGPGNSGGPVFDASGHVVGIFAATISAGRTQSTAAVPIQYGLELLKSQH